MCRQAYIAPMTARDVLSVVLIGFATVVGCETKATPEAERTTSASATSAAKAPAPSATSAPASSASSSSSASPSSSTLPPSRPEPTKLTAGQRTPLGTTGLTIASPFANELAPVGNEWSVQGTAPDSPLIYLLRKNFEPGNPAGAMTCKDPKDANGKKEADGSYVVKCPNNSTNQIWFARTIPIDDEGYHSLQCMGSGTTPATVALVESSCRSIKKK